MKQIVQNCNDYSIYKVDETYLSVISEFVVKSKYMHHLNSFSSDIIQESEKNYQEKLAYLNKNIIDCTRVMKWNKENIHPTEKKLWNKSIGICYKV